MHIIMETVVAFLAAGGLLALGWILFGRLLVPVGEDTFAVVWARGAGETLEHDLSGLLWLRAGGMARMTIVVVDGGLDNEGLALATALLEREPEVYFCAAGELERCIRERGC